MESNILPGLIANCLASTHFTLLALALTGALIAYKLCAIGWNRYCRMQVSVYEKAAKQKIELLQSETVKKKFTLRSEVGQLRYDQNLRLAQEALQEAQSKGQSGDWKGAYKALKEALEHVSEYRLGHLPPRDMPEPRTQAATV
ncbi:MAG: hypothetical protein QG574_3086 [Cyanobacteriota bacterium erpe_2018_sw_21hr_WHONDRS-SW48-000092_B_bin.40]|nr:hypothetical protein [Cyanobacteriota bacterium erpe_2018_sw_21hr_WHONDRS-SW48-000092_B_bin.40]